MNNRYTDSRLNQRASKRLFAEKIAHYAQRDPRHFVQIDGIFAPMYEEGVPIDFEGDFINPCRTVELMHGSNVRVLIPDSTGDAPKGGDPTTQEDGQVATERSRTHGLRKAR